MAFLLGKPTVAKADVMVQKIKSERAMRMHGLFAWQTNGSESGRHGAKNKKCKGYAYAWPFCLGYCTNYKN